MPPPTQTPRDAEASVRDDSGLTEYVPFAILVYAAVGLVVATVRLDPDQMFGLEHLLGFIGSIVAWPLALLELL